MWSDCLLHVFMRNCKSLELIHIYGKLHINQVLMIQTIAKENTL